MLSVNCGYPTPPPLHPFLAPLQRRSAHNILFHQSGPNLWTRVDSVGTLLTTA